MRIPRLLIVLSLLVAEAGVAAAPALSSRPRTATASISEQGLNFSFKPHALSIHRGDTVRWRWCPTTGGCSAEHNVVGFLNGKVKFKHPRNASATRGILSGSFNRRFTKAGTYKVFCTIHGFSMTVRVR
jgi:plastocyanin